jgi:hypothetical protein
MLLVETVKVSGSGCPWDKIAAYSFALSPFLNPKLATVWPVIACDLEALAMESSSLPLFSETRIIPTAPTLTIPDCSKFTDLQTESEPGKTPSPGAANANPILRLQRLTHPLPQLPNRSRL